MTSFQPPYLAEEVVLLLEHLYLGLLPGDDLVLGQTAGDGPSRLVGELDAVGDLEPPVPDRLEDGFAADGIDWQAMVVEYFFPAFPRKRFGAEDLHELGGVPNRFGRDGFDVGRRGYDPNLLGGIRFPGHKENLR